MYFVYTILFFSTSVYITLFYIFFYDIDLYNKDPYKNDPYVVKSIIAWFLFTSAILLGLICLLSTNNTKIKMLLYGLLYIQILYITISCLMFCDYISIDLLQDWFAEDRITFNRIYWPKVCIKTLKFFFPNKNINKNILFAIISITLIILNTGVIFCIWLYTNLIKNKQFLENFSIIIKLVMSFIILIAIVSVVVYLFSMYEHIIIHHFWGLFIQNWKDYSIITKTVYNNLYK